MKQIKFKTFEQFCDSKLMLPNKEEILYYSRFYGQRDWGFCITGFFEKDLDKSGESADYIQVQFYTHDIEYALGTMEIIANRKNKVMTLKGITKENFETVCVWIEDQRRALYDSVTELLGQVNPLVDMTIQEEILEQKVIDND